MISKHPDAAMLVEYSSGSLATAPCISITAHASFCKTCRGSINTLTEIGGELLENSEATPVSEGLLDKVLASLDKEPAAQAENHHSSTKVVDELALSLPEYVQQFLPEGALNWKFLSSSLRVAAISIGEAHHELALHRIKAGGKAPAHDHRGTEITVVLKGSFSDEDGIYQPGDFIVREPGTTHQPIAAQNEECICLSVLSAPIKLTGVKSLLNPFLRFSPS